MEDGEIEDGSEDSHPGSGAWSTDKHTHAWLLLALFERLSGSAAAACNAMDQALKTAAGHVQVSFLHLALRPASAECKTQVLEPGS